MDCLIRNMFNSQEDLYDHFSEFLEYKEEVVELRQLLKNMKTDQQEAKELMGSSINDDTLTDSLNLY